MPDCVLQVFARAPVYGRCKTRLTARLHRRHVYHLYRQLLWASVSAATSFARQADNISVELWCAPNCANGDFLRMRRAFKLMRVNAKLIRQIPGDLGQKMHYAIRSAQKQGRSSVLIGTDCPDWGADNFQSVAQILSNGSNAITPTGDGGFALIATCSKPSQPFLGVQWSSGRELNQTTRRYARAKATPEKTPPKEDIDHFIDYFRARKAGTLPRLLPLRRHFTLR